MAPASKKDAQKLSLGFSQADLILYVSQISNHWSVVCSKLKSKSKVVAIFGWCHPSWMIQLYTFFGAFLHIISLITKPNLTAAQSCIYPSAAKTVHFICWRGSLAPPGMPPARYGTPVYCWLPSYLATT